MKLKQIRIDRHVNDSFNLERLEELLNDGWKIYQRIDDDRYSLFILSCETKEKKSNARSFVCTKDDMYR